MRKTNKAHTATVNRIAKRYGGVAGDGDGIDIRGPALSVLVETQATLKRGLRQLRSLPGPVYLAVTNKEGVAEALRLAAGSDVGVMDPRGKILKPCPREPLATVATPASLESAVVLLVPVQSAPVQSAAAQSTAAQSAAAQPAGAPLIATTLNSVSLNPTTLTAVR